MIYRSKHRLYCSSNIDLVGFYANIEAGYYFPLEYLCKVCGLYHEAFESDLLKAQEGEADAG